MRSSISVVVVAVLLAHAPVGRAQDVPPAPAPAETTAQARQHFDRGVTLIEDGQFAEAVVEFEASLAIRTSPPVLYNLGLSHRGMGKYLKAIERLEEFLGVADATRHAEMRRSATELLEQMRRDLAHANLTVRGGSVQVTIDDVAQSMSDGSHRLVLDPGPHVFAATRPGYRPARLTVNLERGSQTDFELDASASPNPAQLAIETGLRGSQIRINGDLVGQGEYATDLPAGEYHIRVQARGHITQERRVTLRPGAVQRVAITLPEEEPGLHERWWFWASAGAIVASGVVIGFLVIEREGPYEKGTLGFVVEALERR
jgi:hypothetical protein